MLYLKRIIYFMTIVLLLALWFLCFMLPFLPFGWLFIALTIFLILPYFQKEGEPRKDPSWMAKLKKKDKKGWIRKGKVIVQAYFRWAHDK